MKLSEILRENREKSLLDMEESDDWGEIHDDSIYCNNYGLTSLKGSPAHVTGDFMCGNNHITSLHGAPVRVDGDFSCIHNNLTSLEGAPIKIGGNLYGNGNPIKSLTGIGTYFRNGYIREKIIIPISVESHILGILLIPELKLAEVSPFSLKDIFNSIKIINKHLRGDRDILECQEELRSAGLREYGRL